MPDRGSRATAAPVAELRALGFTEHEARVYLTLLRASPATGYEIEKLAVEASAMPGPLAVTAAKFKVTPVIMLSSKDGLFDRARGRMVGSDEYLTKPFTKESLLKTVGHYMAQRSVS